MGRAHIYTQLGTRSTWDAVGRAQLGTRSVGRAHTPQSHTLINISFGTRSGWDAVGRAQSGRAQVGTRSWDALVGRAQWDALVGRAQSGRARGTRSLPTTWAAVTYTTPQKKYIHTQKI